VFYNIVDPQLVPILRERKPDKFPEKLWYQALQNVPDPSCMIPVLAVGFKDLKIRIQEQDKMTAQQLSTLKDIELYIAQLHQKHNLDTTLKLEEYKRRHLELTRRVVRVMKKKEVLTSQGYPPLKSEELFRARLESIQRELNKPNQFKAVLSDLHSTVSMMLNNATTSSVESAISSGSLSADEITSVDRSPTYPQFETLDDESIEKIYTVYFSLSLSLSLSHSSSFSHISQFDSSIFSFLKNKVRDCNN
jgi:nuclear pore complex protein Nup54